MCVCVCVQGAPGSWGCYNALSGASVAQGGAKERAAALRDLCHSALGPQLTDMLSAMMRQHTHQQQSQVHVHTRARMRARADTHTHTHEVSTLQPLQALNALRAQKTKRVQGLEPRERACVCVCVCVCVLQGTDDAYFRQDLLQRIGPHRMQYLQLVDALIYYEDAATNSYS